MKKNNLRITYTVQYLLCDPPKLQMSNFRFVTTFYDEHLSDKNRKKLIYKYNQQYNGAIDYYVQFGFYLCSNEIMNNIRNLPTRIRFLQSEITK